MVKLKTFRSRVLCAFYIFAMLPTIIVAILSMGNTIHILEENVKTLTEKNLEQINQNVEFQLNSYEDVLYQLYTDDKIVELVNRINLNIDPALCRRELIQRLREVASVKPYIESIMIIPQNGNIIFWDKLTAASTKSSWFFTYPMKQDEIVNEIEKNVRTVILPTHYAMTILEQKYFLFHMAHKIIDYRNVKNDVGVVILSLNQKMLDTICNKEYEQEKGEANFLLNGRNEMMSFPVTDYLEQSFSIEVGNEKVYLDNFAKESNLFQGKSIFVHYVKDKNTGWTAVSMMDKEKLLREIVFQKRWVLILITISVAILSIVGYFMTNQLTLSIRKITDAMKRVSKETLSERVKIDENMPEEISGIAEKFNQMLEKLESSIENERKATIKQKNAEIAFLEAQINPHFLYNTLDTINWMAIDEEQYEISDAVNLLAQILRYGISDSNKMVPIWEEIEWLKRYIFLQQYRIKSVLNYQIQVAPEIRECYIHKLLLQVFVENAIKHGIDKEQDDFLLEIRLLEEGEQIKIVIQDNGKGMEETKLKEILEGTHSEKHIGIRNAKERIYIYYGEKSKVELKSEIGCGTTVSISIPKIMEEC